MISISFQSSKYVIKAKDPQLHQINIVVPSFLSGPSLAGTHLVELPAQRALEEEATSLNAALEEEATKVMEVVDSSEDSDEDFGVFEQSFSTESPLATLTYPLHKLAAVKIRPISLKPWCFNVSKKLASSSF